MSKLSDIHSKTWAESMLCTIGIIAKEEYPSISLSTTYALDWANAKGLITDKEWRMLVAYLQ